MIIAFREEIEFSKAREALFGSDEGYRAFQNALMQMPRAGDVVPGAGGTRKVRWSDLGRGKGKRGGIRVLYYYAEEAALILLIYAYDKNKSDLTAEEKHWLRATVAAFHKGNQP